MASDKKRPLDARVVKQEARGRWLDILGCLAPDLAPAIKAGGSHVPCPEHGGKDGFRLFKDANDTGGGVCNTCGRFNDGLSLLMWINGSNFPETVQEVGEFLGLDSSDRDYSSKRAPRAPVEPSEEEKRKLRYKNQKLRDELKRVWKEAVPISQPEAEPVRLYFARRGLRLRYAMESIMIRYHPSMEYFHEGKVIGRYPCMLSLAYDADFNPVTIHRTFLTVEGFKAPVPKAKKLMPYPSDKKLSGGSIPLVDLNDYIGNCTEEGTGKRFTALGVCEGIETALAVIEASEGQMPVWPLISDSLLENFKPPMAVDLTCIYGDQDINGAGKNAAVNLKTRLKNEGRVAVGWLPPSDLIPDGGKGVDWLDVLITKGPQEIPFPKGLRKATFN